MREREKATKHGQRQRQSQRRADGQTLRPAHREKERERKIYRLRERNRKIKGQKNKPRFR